MASCLPPYGRRRFACVVGGTTLVLVALSAAVPAASSGLGAALAVACFARAVYDLAVDARAPREAAPAPAPATKNPVNDGGGDEEAAVPLPAPPVRLYYLDNVKTILTWIVISHHGMARGAAPARRPAALARGPGRLDDAPRLGLAPPRGLGLHARRHARRRLARGRAPEARAGPQAHPLRGRVV